MKTLNYKCPCKECLVRVSCNRYIECRQYIDWWWLPKYVASKILGVDN